jgi:hypothetical protein
MPPHIAHLKTLAIDPRDGNIVYGGIEQGGLFKTIDGGRNWREFDGYARPDDEIYKDLHQVMLFAWAKGFSLFAGTTDGEVPPEAGIKSGGGLSPVSKVAHFRLLQTGTGGPPQGARPTA